nr:hypothetical protein [Salmonella enterica]
MRFFGKDVTPASRLSVSFFSANNRRLAFLRWTSIALLPDFRLQLSGVGRAQPSPGQLHIFTLKFSATIPSGRSSITPPFVHFSLSKYHHLFRHIGIPPHIISSEVNENVYQTTLMN